MGSETCRPDQLVDLDRCRIKGRIRRYTRWTICVDQVLHVLLRRCFGRLSVLQWYGAIYTKYGFCNGFSILRQLVIEAVAEWCEYKYIVCGSCAIEVTLDE